MLSGLSFEDVFTLDEMPELEAIQEARFSLRDGRRPTLRSCRTSALSARLSMALDEAAAQAWIDAQTELAADEAEVSAIGEDGVAPEEAAAETLNPARRSPPSTGPPGPGLCAAVRPPPISTRIEDYLKPKNSSVHDAPQQSGPPVSPGAPDRRRAGWVFCACAVVPRMICARGAEQAQARLDTATLYLFPWSGACVLRCGNAASSAISLVCWLPGFRLRQPCSRTVERLAALAPFGGMAHAGLVAAGRGRFSRSTRLKRCGARRTVGQQTAQGFFP